MRELIKGRGCACRRCIATAMTGTWLSSCRCRPWSEGEGVWGSQLQVQALERVCGGGRVEVQALEREWGGGRVEVRPWSGGGGGGRVEVQALERGRGGGRFSCRPSSRQ